MDIQSLFSYISMALLASHVDNWRNQSYDTDRPLSNRLSMSLRFKV